MAENTATEKTAPAAKAAKEKKTTVTGSVTAAQREKLEAYRWENRKSVSDVVNEALDDFFVKIGARQH